MEKNIGKNISKNLSSKYSHKLLDHATDALKVASKRVIKKTAEANGDLICNKIADRIPKVSKTSPQNNSERNEKEIQQIKYLNS